jgi:hypothetical protein
MDARDVDGKAFNLGGDVYLSAREYVALLARRKRRNFRFHPWDLALLYAQGSARALASSLLGRSSGEKQSYRDLKSSQMLTQINNR